MSVWCCTRMELCALPGAPVPKQIAPRHSHVSAFMDGQFLIAGGESEGTLLGDVAFTPRGMVCACACACVVVCPPLLSRNLKVLILDVFAFACKSICVVTPEGVGFDSF